jgi:oligopeptide/dipeptide ABC transporter ATP-binding protein
MASPLLAVKDLVTGFWSDKGLLVAVDKVSFDVGEAETVCIVGESGSGKSVTSLSLMRLVDFDNGGILNGTVMMNGQDLAQLSQDEMRKIRGSQIAMIFQEPMTALNPVFTVGAQIAEAVMLHEGKTKEDAWKRAVEMLTLVGIPEPATRAAQYPHEFSGGMRQRAMIAVALACNPHLLIADEPTTALDVTIQAQILDLLRHLKDQFKMSIVLITHDMGVAAEMADRIIVMYAGKIVEEGPVGEMFDLPLHPYTMGLLASIPGYNGEHGGRLHTIKGTIPNIAKMPPGCRFHPRCPYATEQCKASEPALHDKNGHRVACHRVDEIAAIRLAEANGKAVNQQ